MATEHIQLFQYLDNLEIPKFDKYEKLRKLPFEKLQEYYSELVEQKKYYKFADGVGASLPKYPNAVKILINALDLKQHEKGNSFIENKVKIKIEKEETEEERNAKFLRKKAEYEEKKRKTEKRAKTIKTKKTLAAIEKILKADDLDMFEKITLIKRCLKNDSN